LNFKLIVTHIIAPLLSIETHIFYCLLYSATVCVTGICVCTHTRTCHTGVSQVVIEPKSVDYSYFFCICKYLLVATFCSFWPLEEFVVNKRKVIVESLLAVHRE